MLANNGSIDNKIELFSQEVFNYLRENLHRMDQFKIYRRNDKYPNFCRAYVTPSETVTARAIYVHDSVKLKSWISSRLPARVRMSGVLGPV